MAIKSLLCASGLLVVAPEGTYGVQLQILGKTKLDPKLTKTTMWKFTKLEGSTETKSNRWDVVADTQEFYTYIKWQEEAAAKKPGESMDEGTKLVKPNFEKLAAAALKQKLELVKAWVKWNDAKAIVVTESDPKDILPPTSADNIWWRQLKSGSALFGNNYYEQISGEFPVVITNLSAKHRKNIENLGIQPELLMNKLYSWWIATDKKGALKYYGASPEGKPSVWLIEPATPDEMQWQKDGTLDQLVAKQATVEVRA